MDQIQQSLKINELEREWVETTWQSTLKDVFLPPEIEPPTVKKLQKLADFLKVRNSRSNHLSKSYWWQGCTDFCLKFDPLTDFFVWQAEYHFKAYGLKKIARIQVF